MLLFQQQRSSVEMQIDTRRANLWLIIQPSYKVCVPERWKSVTHSMDAHSLRNNNGEHWRVSNGRDLNKAYCTLIIP